MRQAKTQKTPTTLFTSPRAQIPVVDRLEYFLRSRASKVVVLALVANTMVANTMVAQLLYNSAGQLVLGDGVLLGYLLISAVCSTLAFALFEVSTIFQLHDLMALDPSIKREIGADTLIKRGYVVLAVSSVINFLSVRYFLALAWHTTAGHASAFPLDNLPTPWNWLYYSLHASAYTAVLFLAGIRALAYAAGGTDRGDDAPWGAAGRRGGGACFTGDRGTHRGAGSGDCWPHVRP